MTLRNSRTVRIGAASACTALMLGAGIAAAPITLTTTATGVLLSAPLAMAQGKGGGGGDERGPPEDRGQGADRGKPDDRGEAEARGKAEERGGADVRGNEAAPGRAAEHQAIVDARAGYDVEMKRIAGPGRPGAVPRPLNDAELRVLVERAWGNDTGDANFRNHGERVSTYVALAKELGYSANIGAMQANFGTPEEVAVPAGEALADWQSVSLDYNKDGVVNEADLIAARARPRAARQ